MRSRAMFLGAITCLSLLLVGACGGGEEDSPTDAATATTVSSTPTSAPASGPPTSTTIPPTPGDDDLVSVGRNIFLTAPDNVGPQALWCSQCHLVADVPGAGGLIGPELSYIGDNAATRKPGLSAEEYIRESVRDPGAFICDVSRCTAGLMTSAITENLTEEQVDSLVAFLLTLE